MKSPKKNAFSPYHGQDYVYREKHITLPHHVLMNSLKRVYESAVDSLKLPKVFTPELFAGASVSSLISVCIALSDAEKPTISVASPHLIAGAACAFIAVALWVLKLLDINKFKSDYKRRDRCVRNEMDALYRESSPFSPGNRN